MIKLFRIISYVLAGLILATICFGLTSCMEIEGSQADTNSTVKIANRLQSNQPTPNDIDYSLERYNLIKRAYWVNGQREKAMSVPCAIERPLGYIVLFTESGAVVGSFIVDGKVTSLNSYLTPDSTRYATNTFSDWLADVDGSYGENDNGIFFFTPDGRYLEWTGTYLYSDIPFIVDNPVLNVAETEEK